MIVSRWNSNEGMEELPETKHAFAWKNSFLEDKNEEQLYLCVKYKQNLHTFL